MSARQPFVPQGRSISKPTSSIDQDTAANNSDKLKSADDSDTSLTNSSGYSLQSTNSGDSLMLKSSNKPLNIGNLGKSKKAHTVGSNPFGAKRNSFEEDGTRVFSPVPKPFGQRGMKSNTSPFFASTASFQPVSAFRTPRVPSPTKRHSAASIEDLNANQAHTFAPGPLLTVSNADANGQQAEDSQPISTDHVTRHKDIDHMDRFGERHETAAQAFDLNEDASGSLDGYNPPPYAVGLEGTSTDDHYTMVPLRRVKKRIDRNEDRDVDLEYSSAKRYKVDEDREMQSNYASRRATPLPQYQSDHSPRRTPSPTASHAGSMYAPSVGRAPLVPLSASAAANIHGQHALYRLFGQDLDAYVDVHADAYEQAKKKWTECTIEEWRAGADELTTKFASLLDFVKDHMSTKLSLYASFTDSLAAHQKVLGGREDILDEVRDTLIRNGGNVVQAKDETKAGREGNEKGTESGAVGDHAHDKCDDT